jgi:hypothetical protein
MVFLGFRYCLRYSFIDCFRSLLLGAVDFENLQDLEDQDFEQQVGE